MSRVSFTAKRVSEFGCPEGRAQAFLWDEGVAGLGLRATANGAKAYIFQSVLGGKTLRSTIGSPSNWSIKDAQAEARRLQTLIDKGVDPRQAKVEQIARDQSQRQSAKTKRLQDSVMVSEVWAEYLKDRRPRWSERSYSDHVRLSSLGGVERLRAAGVTKPGVLSSIMMLKLSDLTSERLTLWLDRESKTRPTSTAQAFRLLRAFIRWCAEHHDYKAIVPLDSYRAGKVREAVPVSRPREGDCLQREQLPAWFRAVREIGNPVISAYLQGLVLTGARREELGALRWTDVDFKWNTLAIGDKVEGDRDIPLTPYLSQLLRELPRQNEWVFSSKTARDGRLVEPTIAHRKALKQAGLPHVSVHGLRRSFGTLAEWVEMPTGVVEQIMGHKPSAIAEKHYRRRPIDLLRQWHIKLENWILLEAGLTPELVAIS